LKAHEHELIFPPSDWFDFVWKLNDFGPIQVGLWFYGIFFCFYYFNRLIWKINFKKLKKYYFNKLKNKFYQSSNHDGDTATGEASNQSP